jgi:hypothetical protein
MTLLNERQQTAEALTREINAMGAWVVSPMPLDDNSKLRFQVLDRDRNAIIEKLSSWDWSPIFVSVLPRICPNGMVSASLYEIDLPKPRQPVFDDRIYGEIGRKEDNSLARRECEAILKDWYGK